MHRPELPEPVRLLLEDLAAVDPSASETVGALRDRAAALLTPLEPLLSSGEVAAFLGVDRSTVTNWADSGLLRCTTTQGQHRRFAPSEVRRYLVDHGHQIPEALRAPTP